MQQELIELCKKWLTNALIAEDSDKAIDPEEMAKEIMQTMYVNLSTGLQMIEIERNQQIQKHGFTTKKDARYTNSELTRAAMAFAAPKDLDVPLSVEGVRIVIKRDGFFPPQWFPRKFSPSNRKREVAIAGALCAAEIDRIEFAEKIAGEGKS